MKKVLIALAILVLVLGVTGAILGYLFTRSLSHPPEETAKFLPPETSLYFSMNLRPGAGQMMKGREILDRFRKDPRFDEKLDELYDSIDEEVGIDVREDLFPWMGPEVALAVIEFDGFDEDPKLVAFIGTTDAGASESFIRKLLAYGEELGETEWEEGVTQGYITFIVEPDEDFSLHVAITEDYIVVATTSRLLKSTLARMDSDEDQLTLLDKPGFRKARDSAENPRFGIMYLDVAGIVDQLSDEFDGPDLKSLQLLDDQFPEFIVASAAFLDKGMRLSTSFETPDTWPDLSVSNSLASAGHTPGDVLAFLSFAGAYQSWEDFKRMSPDELEDVYQALDEVESEIGIHLEQDILSWMTGELAFALLLPDGASLGFEELHANLYVEFDDRANAISKMEKITSALDLEEIDAANGLHIYEGPDGFSPGYTVLGDYIVIGTTRTALEQAIAAEEGEVPSLSDDSTFNRSLKAAGNNPEFMIYANIQRIVDATLDTLDETDLQDYRDSVSPFVAPLKAFLFWISVQEDISTFSAEVTIE